MKTVEVELTGRASELRGRPGIAFAHRPLARRTMAEPALTAMLRPGFPYEWQYVATRENEVPEDVLRAAGAIKIGVDRHRSGRDASGPGREVARDLGRRPPPGERQGQRRPWHVRLLARDGLGHQQRGDRRLRRRRTAPHGQGRRRRRQLQRRRRGRRDHLRGRPRREDRQSLDRRRGHLRARAEGRALRSEPQRAARRRGRQRVRGGEPDRVPRRRAPAARLERTGRVRPVGRSQHDRGEARVLLEHRLADLPRSARRKRLRRPRLDFLAGVVAALRPARLPGGPLRLVERDVVLEPRGRRRGGSRLGREPVADRPAGGRDPQVERLGQRKMESTAWLRRDRRRGRRRQGSGPLR